MSVNFSQYWVYGVVTGYPESEEAYDVLEDYCQSNRSSIEHKQGLAVLLDGMGGKYMVAGRILEKSELDYPLGSGPVAVPDVSDEIKAEVALALREQLGLTQTPTVVLVTHYS